MTSRPTIGTSGQSEPGLVVVVAAHGSRAEEANETHRSLVQDLSLRLGILALPAFLELAEPSIPAALSVAADGGAVRILVLPFFLHPGRHLREDVPALVEQAREQHPGVTIDVLGAFGADPGVLDALTRQVTAALGASK